MRPRRSEHTPGPWVVYMDGARRQIKRDGYYGFLAHVSGVSVGPRKADANALLIAAAPDLLDAATAVLDSASWGDANPAIARLRAAVSKATKRVPTNEPRDQRRAGRAEG